MSIYNVEFVYNIPEYGNINLTANSEVDAERIAREQLEEQFPEALDLEIIGVEKIGE